MKRSKFIEILATIPAISTIPLMGFVKPKTTLDEDIQELLSELKSKCDRCELTNSGIGIKYDYDDLGKVLPILLKLHDCLHKKFPNLESNMDVNSYWGDAGIHMFNKGIYPEPVNIWA